MSWPSQMRPEAQRVALQAKGFLSLEEGVKLLELACSASRLAAVLEIGSYCGKSALYLGEGCRLAGRHVVFSIDHHRGSEEQQPGQRYFDPDVYDAPSHSFDTLRHFVRNIQAAGLTDWVVPLVGTSSCLARHWPGAELGLVFIDGGHSDSDVRADFEGWSRLVVKGGYLCFHDIYPNPADGGQAPYRVFQNARAQRQWAFVGLFGSLGVLQRK